MKREKTVFKVIIWTILILLGFIFLYPIFSMVMKSLMTQYETRALPPQFLPKTPLWRNYFDALGYVGEYEGVPYMLVYFKNTMIIILGVVVGGTLSSSMCAFGFSKLKFKGRDLIFFIVLATMMIPGSVMMISLYTIFNKLGWINHLYPLWVPTWFGGGAVSIFLTRQFMRTLPDELNQSAKIDGANYWQLYSRIIMPNCKPILIVLIIQYFTGSWNDLMGPLLYTNTQEMWTLTLGVTNMGQGQMNTTGGTQMVMAACALMVLFPAALFLFGQKYFIDSVVLTGIKG